MKETEKIEIMHFDQEGYLEDGKALYETGKKMTALADNRCPQPSLKYWLFRSAIPEESVL